MVNKLSLPATDNEVQTKVNEVVDDINTNVVHKTGNEKITGTKTFEGNSRIVVLRNSTVTYNTAPSSDTFTDLSFRDKNGDEMAALEHVRYPNNNSAFRLLVKGVDGNWSTSLEVGKKANGDVYTKANTPSSSDNSQQIATTAFVNTAVSTKSNDNAVVHLSGNETITGDKTFSNTIVGSINGNAATVTNGVYTTGNQTIGGTKTFSAAAYGKASDAVNSILTTVLINKSANGKLKLGNGFMIQWFTQNLSSSVSFPTPFDNGCVFVAVVDGQANTMGVSNITKTGFEYRQSYDLPRACRVFAIGY